jgi:Matrixin/Carboxypeptidase regulatory-like domain
MKRAVLSLVLISTFALLLFYSAPATSFVPENGSIRAKWRAPINYVVNPSHGGNITGTETVQAVITDSFAKWQNAPNTALPIGTINGTTSSTTLSANDNTNVICFTCTPSGGFGKDAIAITLTAIETTTGNIVDADMVFNTTTSFITDPVPATDPAESLQTVATHEFGHFLGLDHTAVVRAVMNPFAPPLLLTLSYDDLAGISTNYPAAGFTPLSISGTVTNGAGAPVFGAHVFAESTTNTVSFPSIRKSPISALTNANGTYTISGVPADTYEVTAEPLDSPVSNQNFNGSPAFNTSFTTRQH